MSKKLTYFISDLHLGGEPKLDHKLREKIVVQWLKEIKPTCKAIYFVGDVFDFWFEYKMAIPKGFSRFFGQLADMADSGIELHFFAGNHDMWLRDYLQSEFNMNVHMDELSVVLDGKSFHIAHGDGLGPGDKKYKFMKYFFRSKLMQFLFRMLPADIGLSIMKKASSSSREFGAEEPIQNIKEEWLVLYAERTLKRKHFDYFIFGHRHVPIRYLLSNNKSIYVNLGDWLEFCTYGVWDGNELQLNSYNDAAKEKIFIL